MTNPEKNFEGHFATRARAGAINDLFSMFPDPDPILRRKGIGVSALRNLLSDEHLEAVSSVRRSTVSGAPWHLEAGDDSEQAAAALKLAAKAFSALDMTRIIDELMEHVFYGYKPAEILWRAEGNYWLIDDIVGKPPEWFAFDNENVLVFRGRGFEPQSLTEKKFLCPQYHASYDNPYGQKAFSKCFWPVTFKRSGWQWWTTFVEKYGGVIALGKYPQTLEKQKDEILDLLAQMVADAVGVVPEGTSVEFKEAAGKGAASTVYAQYLEAADNAISKALLGQTLTTQIGKNGSYAAAVVHDQVRQDLVIADKSRMAGTLQIALNWFAEFNFGPQTAAPRFVFNDTEDLKKEKAERDKVLYELGVRFKKEHIAVTYNIPLEHFDIDASTPAIPATPFSTRRAPRNDTSIKGLASLFRFFRATREERAIIKDQRIMDQFRPVAVPRLRAAVEQNVDSLLSRLSKANNYDEAFEVLAEVFPDLEVGDLASVMDEIRYMASQVGAHSA